MRGVDAELVKQAQHGDREAFGLLAAELAPRLLAVSRRILRDLDLAEDATQQALVAIWRELPQLGRRSASSTAPEASARRDPARRPSSGSPVCAQVGARAAMTMGVAKTRPNGEGPQAGYGVGRALRAGPKIPSS